MTSELAGVVLAVGMVAATPGLMLLALRRPAPDEPRQAILCEAVGGPCDGRTWFLPELAPIWLRYDGRRHLYRPAGPGSHGAEYRYADVSEPAVLTPARTVRG